MQIQRVVMGMPVTVEIVDKFVQDEDVDMVFKYFNYVDETFSTYKTTSETSQINAGLILEKKYSADMREVLVLAEKTKLESGGYFNARKTDGSLDPLGIVKGWAIQKAGQILLAKKYQNFYIEAGGDIQTYGKNKQGEPWSVGIRNPFNTEQIVKTVRLSGEAIATSGTYLRGQHIYNPHEQKKEINDIVSLSVICPNICDADRFATAAFAMGKNGINFIAGLPGFAGYMINTKGIATMTENFTDYTL
ncbi:MAG: FAD:protein FMN transferase [bacterium]|nr:FAD:protein FMN transferase [bacterium]